MINSYIQEAVKKGARKVHPDILMLQIMESMGWSYDDYINTPARILDLLIQKQQIDFKLKKDGK